MIEAIQFFFSHLSTQNLDQLISWGGLTVLTIIVFSETGLLVGFFLPGDSLLVTAGVIAARGHLDITTMIIVLCIAAIVGDAVGYSLGYKIGPKIFAREDSMFFKKSHLVKTKEFYEKYGGKTIIIARFVPIIRTFAPFIAGVAEMNYARFALYNITGGIGWIVSMCMTGYYIGNKFPLKIVIPIVIFISILPIIYELAKAWFEKKKVKQGENN
jgi:membrane-associated protein